ncbi:MAG: DnaK suppressor protein [Halieaceae bacterium]|jgi:DnaK suppressor protein
MTTVEQRIVLETKLVELKQRLAHVRKDVTKPLSSDFSEQATERENDEVLEEIARETQMSIQEIRLALKRLEGDRYGRCRACESAIEEKRLAILPGTSLCAECAENP